MEIVQLSPIAFQLDFAGEYTSGIVNSTFVFKALRSKITETEIVTVFEFVASSAGLTNDFSLDISVRMPFIITGQKFIGNEDCLEIIKKGIDYLKKICNTSLYPLETSLDFAIPPLDIVKMEMKLFLEETNEHGSYNLPAMYK